MQDTLARGQEQRGRAQLAAEDERQALVEAANTLSGAWKALQARGAVRREVRADLGRRLKNMRREP